jgi:hypothetical protein
MSKRPQTPVVGRAVGAAAVGGLPFFGVRSLITALVVPRSGFPKRTHHADQAALGARVMAFQHSGTERSLVAVMCAVVDSPVLNPYHYGVSIPTPFGCKTSLDQETRFPSIIKLWYLELEFYIETVLVEDDPDDPTIHIVSIHDA